MERVVAAMEGDPFCDDLPMMGTTGQRMRCEHYAGIIAPIVAEACVALIEQQKAVFASDEYATPQPLGSHSERFACGQCIDAIRQTYGSTK